MKHSKAFLLFLSLFTAAFSYAGEERLSSFTDLDAALTAIDDTPTHLVIDTNATLTANTIIKSNITLDVTQGAIIDTQGYELEIKGGLHAEAFQIFDLTLGGAIAFKTAEVQHLYPEWWKVDGTADQVEIDLAMSSVGANYQIPVKLSGKTYNFNATLYLDTGAILVGDATIINSPFAGPAFRMNTDVELRGSYIIDGNDVVGSIGLGYHSLPIYHSKVEKVEINNCTKAVFFYSNGGHGVYYNTIDNLVAVNNNIGVEFKTVTSSAGGAQVNANHIKFASINNNDGTGLIVEGSHGNSFGYLELERNGIQYFHFDAQGNKVFENSKSWGLRLINVNGFTVNSGWIEKNGALREIIEGLPFHDTDETNIHIDDLTFDTNGVLDGGSRGIYITANVTDYPVSVHHNHFQQRSIRLQTQTKFYSHGQENFESIKVNKRSPLLGTSNLTEQQVMRSARLQIDGLGSSNVQVYLANRFNGSNLPTEQMAAGTSTDYYHLSGNGYDLRLDRYAFCEMLNGSCDPAKQTQTLIVGHLNGNIARNNTGTNYTVELETGVGIYFRLYDLNGNQVKWTDLAQNDSIYVDFSYISGEPVQ